MKEFFPFRLDVENQCLWKVDQRIQLTPKAFSILAYLVEHAGQLVSQAELLEALWPDTYVQPEVLKTHIRDVRTALGDNAKNARFIETLHRRGYRFIAEVSEVSEVPHSELPVIQPKPVPLIGMEQNLNALNEYVEALERGESRIVFISGEAGIGKTTLVKAFEQQSLQPKRVIRVLRGQCVEVYGTREPYYPVLEAIAQLLRGPESDVVVQILSTQAPTWLVQFPGLLKQEQRELLYREVIGSTRERMLREICDALVVLTQKIPIVMILEDVHWADHHTVDWFSAMARGGRKSRILILATLRPVELAVTKHPLKLVKQQLLAHKLCHQISVEPLNEIDVEKFLQQKAPGGTVPLGLAELIFRHSEGNPLFMGSAGDHLGTSGLFTIEQGRWEIKRSLDEIEMMVPETLRQMIDAHIELCLSDAEQHALEVASVSGVSFCAIIISNAANLGKEETEDFFDRLAQKELFIRPLDVYDFPNGSQSPRYEFLHAYYREVLYRRLAMARKLRLHQKIGEVQELLFLDKVSNVAAQLAHHFEESHDWRRSARYLLLVAEKEEEQLAFQDAAQGLKHALELLHKLPENEIWEQEIQVLNKLAAAYALSDNFSLAVETLRIIVHKAQLSYQSRIEARAHTRLAFMLCRSDAKACLAAIDRALALNELETDPLALSRVDLSSALWRIVGDRWLPENAQKAKSAFNKICQLGSEAEMGRPYVEYALIQFVSSEYREGFRHTQLGIPLLIQQRDIEFRGGQLVAIWQLLFLGEWGKCLDQIHSLCNGSQKDGNLFRLHIWKLQLGWLYEQMMHSSGVFEYCDPREDLYQNPAMGSFHRQCLILRASAEIRVGNLDEARQLLLFAQKLMAEHSVFLDWYWKMPLDHAFAELALADGKLQEAQTAASALLSCAEPTAERTWKAIAWETNARVASAVSDSSLAKESIGKALEIVHAGDLPLAEWRVHRTASKILPEKAVSHRQYAAKILLQLAESLSGYASLKEIFLGTKEVRSLLEYRTVD
jgi:DNA-binding winged helix-turn-helix (wHTH) protein